MGGFNHSVKVPVQYKRAAKILQKAIEEKKPIKSLVFEEKHKVRSVSAIIKAYATNRNLIEQLIEESKILESNERLDKYLCKILVAEFVFGSKNIKSEAKPVQTVQSYTEQFSQILKEKGLGDSTNKEKSKKPRYVRVNTNLTSMEELSEILATENFIKKEYNGDSYDDFIEALKSLDEMEYLVDFHVTNLLVFSPKTASYFARHKLVKSRKVFLQDKGTCLVAELLSPETNSVILDMCAAPGMKSIHACNIMKNQGTIYCVERDNDRYKILETMLTESGATCAKPVKGDSMSYAKTDFPDVEYIFVDPSCSGSGIQNRLNVIGSDEKDPSRLRRLAGLQIKLLSHAMSEFPTAKKIVYSTCSLYEEENEQVIEKCLSKHPEFKLLSCKKALRNKWNNTGNKEYKGIGKNCIYTRPDSDFCDGIFISILERKNE